MVLHKGEMTRAPRPRRLLLGILLILLPSLFTAGVSRAQVINVTPGDVPALIAAIQAANATPAVPATLSITGTYTLANGMAGIPFAHDGKTGLPSITSDITIVGAGAIIERDLAKACVINGDVVADEFRIFHVASGGKLTLRGIVARNGCADGTTFQEKSGGGIYNAGEVRLEGSTLSGNFATSGGAIANSSATVHIVMDSTLTKNRAENEGGGIATFGTSAIVRVTNSTLSENEAKFFGGGIENFNGQVYITNSTLAMNKSGTEGGGVFNSFSMLNQPVLTVTGSTFYKNESDLGGGIFTSEKVDVIASTFVENTARVGGGIWKEGLELNVTNSTFSANGATEMGGGIYNDDFDVTIVSSTFLLNGAGEGGALFNFGTANVRNSILADSTSGNDCDGPESADMFATGVNFDSDGSCKAAATISSTGDAFTTVSSAELNLDALTVNPPGQTATHALLENSVAIDAVPPGECTVDEDQRGVPRPQAGRCESGAFEVDVEEIPVHAPILSPWALVLLIALLSLAPWWAAGRKVK
jgi:hypothetical protein